MCKGSSSGVFVAKLVKHLPPHVRTTVVAPNAPCHKEELSTQSRLHAFRYAPSRLERLAHAPGGIPVALNKNPSLYLLVPSFLLGMFLGTLRQTRNADVIHANWTICGLIGGLVGLVMGVPVVTTVRGEDVARVRSSSLYRHLLSATVRLSSAVITVSDALRCDLVQWYPQHADTFHTIPNGVDESFLSVGKSRRRRVHPAELRLITVGSLISRKGIVHIINAAAQVAHRAAIRLQVVGAGPEQASLEAQVSETKMEDRVQFLGPAKPSAIPTLLADSDVFVLASHSEGRPNAVLEAMACGLAVVASDIPGVNELVTHHETGLLFRAGDSDQLADRLLELSVDSDLRLRLAENARRYVFREKLFWQTTAERYEAVYRQAIGGCRG